MPEFPPFVMLCRQVFLAGQRARPWRSPAASRACCELGSWAQRKRGDGSPASPMSPQSGAEAEGRASAGAFREEDRAGGGGGGAMADDARVNALAAYPVRFMAFDKEAFTADIVNAVIEISTTNFTEMETHATRMLNITSKESLDALQQGLSTVFEKFLSKFMEEHLAPWEAYCRDYCFEVPDDLVLPEKLDAPLEAREVEDAKLDSELNSLRERKAAAEKAVAELCRAIKALEAHVEAKACFMDAFDQLQNLHLVDDMGTVVRELRKSVEEANALRAQRYQKQLFPADPSAAGK